MVADAPARRERPGRHQDLRQEYLTVTKPVADGLHASDQSQVQDVGWRDAGFERLAGEFVTAFLAGKLWGIGRIDIGAALDHHLGYALKELTHPVLSAAG